MNAPKYAIIPEHRITSPVIDLRLSLKSFAFLAQAIFSPDKPKLFIIT
ncbi:MAG: hypothetical protein ACK52J_01285 [bacterium]|jgi:hypothetical protein